MIPMICLKMPHSDPDDDPNNEIDVLKCPPRISNVSDVKKLPWFNTVDWDHIRWATFPLLLLS